MTSSPTIITQAIISCFLLLLSFSSAAEPFELPVDANHLSLKEHILLFTDTDDKYTELSSLLTGDIDFIPLPEKPKGHKTDRHWLKIELHNPRNKPYSGYLDLGFPSFHHLHAYWYQSGKISTITELSADSKYDERPVDVPLVSLPISLATNETKTLYLHYQAVIDIPLDLKLFSPSNFNLYRQQEDSINNFLLGFMLAFLCVISVQWVLNHKLTYLYYVGLILSMTLIVSDMSGYNFKYLWPEYGLWTLDVPPIIMSTLSLFYLLFVREFLSLKSKSNRLYQVFTGLIYFAIPVFGSILLFNIQEAFVIYGILSIPLLIFTSFWAVKQKMVSAKIFSLSIFSYVLFVYILFIGAGTGFTFFPKIHLTFYPKLGYALEVLFFTIALAVQNRQLQKNYTESLQNRLAEAEILALVEKEKTNLLAEIQNKILQFATSTHDLAQPLSSVRMALGAMPKEAGQEIKLHIDKTVAYAEELLRTIIRDTRADFIDNKSDASLSELFKQAIEQQKHQAQAKCIELSYFHSRRRINTSSQSLLRILDNLLANAIRYTDSGRVFLGVRQKAEGIQIQVWDTGPGIHVDTIKRLLEPFEQSGQLDAEKQGYGLGLYIVKILCQKSGYQFSIYSEQGKGSCFAISLQESSTDQHN